MTAKTTDTAAQLVRCELVNAPAHDGVHAKKRNCRNPQPEIVDEQLADAAAEIGTDALVVATDAGGDDVTAVGELLNLSDADLIDAAAGDEIELTAEQLAARDAEQHSPERLAEIVDNARDARPEHYADDAAAKTDEPTGVAVTVFVGADGNFKIHKPGCRDIARELKNPHVDADTAHDTAYVSVEQAIRDLWSDQIGDNWSYERDGEPSLDYLAEHSFVGSVDVLPCIARKLVALPTGDAEPTAARTPRAPRTPKAEPKFGAALGALDSIAGYVVVKSTPMFDQLKRSDLGGDPLPNALGDAAPDAPAADRPEWLTRCNVHGKTTTAANRKAGRGLGATAARALWCSGCKRAAAKTAAAADATAEHDAAAKSE
jgi:hypothetical protein